MLGDEARWMANNRARVCFGLSLLCEPGVVYLSLFSFSLTLLFLSSQSSHLSPSYKPILRAPCLYYVAIKMATTVHKFPVIKEVRTFLVEGVGSGGDYHNVRHRIP